MVELLPLTIMIGLLILYVLIGAYYGRKVKEANEFYIAGRSLAFLPLFGTYLATYFSGVSMMGYPGDLYSVGIAALWLPVFWAIGTILLILVALKFYEYNITTPTDFMRAKYGSKTLEVLVAITTIVALLFGLTVQFVVMGITWSVVLGRPFSEGVIITAIVIAIIVAIGGLVSVAYSDIVKALVFVIAIIVGAVYTFTAFGSPMKVLNSISQIKPELLDPFRGYTIPGLIMLFFVWSLGVAVHPQYLQRITAARNLRIALAQYTAWFILAIIYFLLFYLAMASRVALPELPKGYTKDYALVLYFRDYTPSIIFALWCAGLVAAALSTTDSVIQLITSIFNINVVRVLKPDISGETLLRLGRILPFVLVALVAIFAIYRPAPVVYLGGYAWGLLAIGYFAPVFLGLYYLASREAAILSVLIGWALFIAAQTLSFLKMWPYPVPPVALGVIASTVTYLVLAPITSKRSSATSTR